MLQELRQMTGDKERFMTEYRPIRKTIEEFLKGGEKISGHFRDRLFAVLTDLEFGRRAYPRWERTLTVTPEGQDPFDITVRTDGELFPFSQKVQESFIVIKVKSGLYESGPFVVFPPTCALIDDQVNWRGYANTPAKVADILPFLSANIEQHPSTTT